MLNSFCIYFSLVVTTLLPNIQQFNCESHIVSYNDIVRHEGYNLTSEMEDEIISHTTQLIVKANGIVNVQTADNLAEHMGKTFNGTWNVIITEGMWFGSRKTRENQQPFLRFSYQKFMLTVRREDSVLPIKSEIQILRDSIGQPIDALIHNELNNTETTKISNQIIDLLRREHDKTFDDFARSLFLELYSSYHCWAIDIGHKDSFGWDYSSQSGTSALFKVGQLKINVVKIKPCLPSMTKNIDE